MKELYEKYLKYMDESLILAVASNPSIKDASLPVKLKVTPVHIKGGTAFQVTRTVGPKELHENLSAEGAAQLLASSVDPEDTVQPQHFRQMEIRTETTVVVTMVGKRGTITTKEHKNPVPKGVKTAPDTFVNFGDGRVKTETTGDVSLTGKTGGVCVLPGSQNLSVSHNRKKNYVLEEGVPVPFLVQLGVMTPAGAVVKARYDKFRQINRYLEFVEDIIPSLPKGREISIIDFGCGKSYLTFALYYYLHEKQGYDVKITGLDLKADVIAECNRLAESFGYEKLEFLHGDIADYTGTDSVDMVVTLHACDTATDYALYKAISWGAKVIFCVPCCQHELNKQIKDDARRSVMKYGLIKERIAALYTDAFRANMLEEQGYKTQVLEFIDMEHTPKNILIRAVKTGKKMLPKGAAELEKSEQNEYVEVMRQIGAEPTLYRLLHDTH